MFTYTPLDEKIIGKADLSLINEMCVPILTRPPGVNAESPAALEGKTVTAQGQGECIYNADVVEGTQVKYPTFEEFSLLVGNHGLLHSEYKPVLFYILPNIL